MNRMSVFLVLLLTLCVVLPAGAQIHLGVLGGLNLANINIDPWEEEEDWSSRTAFGFGGVFDYGLSEHTVLTLEPMYLQKGATLDFQGGDAEFKVAYLEVPVMFKYVFGAAGIRPYVMAGPTIGFNLSAEGETRWDGESETEDIKDETKSIDFGLGFGGGIYMPAGNNFIFVEARYALGLTNINDDPDNPDIDIKTKGIQIFAGITFPVGAE